MRTSLYFLPFLFQNRMAFLIFQCRFAVTVGLDFKLLSNRNMWSVRNLSPQKSLKNIPIYQNHNWCYSFSSDTIIWTWLYLSIILYPITCNLSQTSYWCMLFHSHVVMHIRGEIVYRGITLLEERMLCIILFYVELDLYECMHHMISLSNSLSFI